METGVMFASRRSALDPAQKRIVLLLVPGWPGPSTVDAAGNRRAAERRSLDSSGSSDQ
jgi:hypothetical protein